MWTEGGFHRIIPPRDPVGDQDLRTHPQAKAASRSVNSISIASASRFQTQGKIQRKSQRNIATWSALFNRSTAVTNRVMLWKECRNNYVNNFVSKYPRNLLHMSLNLPSNISASVVHNIVRNFLNAFVEHSAIFHIGIFTTTND